MKDNHHKTSERHDRQERPGQQKESMLERIKHDVKSWFADDEKRPSNGDRASTADHDSRNNSDHPNRQQYDKNKARTHHDDTDDNDRRQRNTSSRRRNQSGGRQFDTEQDSSPKRNRNYRDYEDQSDEEHSSGGYGYRTSYEASQVRYRDDRLDHNDGRGNNYGKHSARNLARCDQKHQADSPAQEGGQETVRDEKNRPQSNSKIKISQSVQKNKTGNT